MYIQALDVFWNTPFKAACSVKYDKWLGTVGILKNGCWKFESNPEKNHFCSGFLILGYELPSKVIKKSLSSCALNLPMGGSKDDMIHCLKEGQSCSGGRSLLRSQLG